MTFRLSDILRQKTTGEFIRFVIVGVIATIIHYGVYYLLKSHVNVNVSYTIGYVVSWLFNLFLTMKFIFHSVFSWKKTIGFAGSHTVNYVLHMLFLNLFLWLGFSITLASLPTYCCVVPINFVLVRTVFKSKKFSQDQENK